MLNRSERARESEEMRKMKYVEIVEREKKPGVNPIELKILGM